MSATEFERRTDLFYAGELPADMLFDDIWCEDQPSGDYPAMSESSRLVDARYRELSSEATYLTDTEESDCATRIQNGKSAARQLETAQDENTKNRLLLEIQDGIKARDTLVLTNLRYAGWLVRESMDFNKKQREESGRTSYRGRIVRDIYKLSGGELDYDERLQIVTEALIEAAEKYTGTSQKGYPVSFPNWALMRMEATLLREMSVRSGQSPLTMGPGVMQALNHYRKVKKELEAQKNSDVKIYELANELGMHSARLLELEEADVANQPISFEVIRDYLRQKFAEEVTEPEMEEDPLELADVLIDGGTDLSVEDEALEDVFGQGLDLTLSSLYEREQRVIELRYGFDDDNKWTSEEVGREFGVTGQRIRQIEAEVLKKLTRQVLARSPKHRGWNRRAAKDDYMMDLITGTQVGSRRPILAIDEADDIRLGIRRSRPYNSRDYNGPREGDIEEKIAGTRKTYSLEEFDQMR